MKTTISLFLVENSVDFIEASFFANSNKQIESEVRTSIGAIVMMAFAIEGIINEVGEVAFGKDVWNKNERKRTIAKWKKIFTFFNKNELQHYRESLVLIEKIISLRHKIVHPKILDLGIEGMIRTRNKKLIKPVNRNYILKEGDTILIGFDKLYTEFNFENTLKIISQSLSTLKLLRDNILSSGLEWLNDFELKLKKYA